MRKREELWRRSVGKRSARAHRLLDHWSRYRHKAIQSWHLLIIIHFTRQVEKGRGEGCFRSFPCPLISSRAIYLIVYWPILSPLSLDVSITVLALISMKRKEWQISLRSTHVSYKSWNEKYMPQCCSYSDRNSRLRCGKPLSNAPPSGSSRFLFHRGRGDNSGKENEKCYGCTLSGSLNRGLIITE